MALRGSSNVESVLGGLSVHSTWYSEAPRCLRSLFGTLTGSEWCTKAKQLDGVHYAGLQLMPHDIPKLRSYLGCWAGPCQLPSEMPMLHGWMEFTVQAFGSCYWAQQFPGHSGFLGRAQPAQRDLPQGLWLIGDAEQGPYQVLGEVLSLHGWVKFTVQAFSSYVFVF